MMMILIKKGSFEKWKNMDNQFRHFVVLQLNQTEEVPQMEGVFRHSKSVKISTSALFAPKKLHKKTRKPVSYKIRDKTP